MAMKCLGYDECIVVIQENVLVIRKSNTNPLCGMCDETFVTYFQMAVRQRQKQRKKAHIRQRFTSDQPNAAGKQVSLVSS